MEIKIQISISLETAADKIISPQGPFSGKVHLLIKIMLYDQKAPEMLLQKLKNFKSKCVRQHGQ